MTYKTIDDFNLDEVLTEQSVIEETDRFGDTWRHKRLNLTPEGSAEDISEDITLLVFESGQAAMEIGVLTFIEFLWTEEVAELFERFDEVKAVEMFEILGRNKL